MDYEQTALMYGNVGLTKKMEAEPWYSPYQHEKKWYEKVKSPKSGEYYQAEELIKRELVPAEWKPPHVDSKGKPVKYPIKHTNSIYRIRAADGSEWLKSRQMWIGLDQAGNPVSQSMDDKELYDDILPIRTPKPKNPKDNPRFRDTEMVLQVTSFEHRTKYTLPYKPENIQKLYDMRNGKCSLILKDESGSDHPPVEVTTFEAFKSRPWDELWEMVTTPRYKMEPSTTQDYQKQYA
jgi:hypothetical protein